MTEIDHTFPAESRRRAEDLLVEQKATYFIQVFGSVKHGFALRGDPKVPVESKHPYRWRRIVRTNSPSIEWAKEESARGILNWFDHFCG